MPIADSCRVTERVLEGGDMCGVLERVLGGADESYLGLLFSSLCIPSLHIYERGLGLMINQK